MDLKRNQRFFKQNDILRLIGGGLVIVALVWYWLGYSIASYYGPIIMAPIGLVMFLVTSSRAVPESEIRQVLKSKLEDLGADIEADPALARRVLERPAPYRCEVFCFDERACAFRRGKDAAVFSNVYCATGIWFTAEALLLRGRQIDLLTDQVAEVDLMIPWEELEGARHEVWQKSLRMTNSRNAQATLHGATLTITGREGQVLYTAPVLNDMDSEVLCDSINQRASAAAH